MSEENKKEQLFEKIEPTEVKKEEPVKEIPKKEIIKEEPKKEAPKPVKAKKEAPKKKPIIKAKFYKIAKNIEKKIIKANEVIINKKQYVEFLLEDGVGYTIPKEEYNKIEERQV